MRAFVVLCLVAAAAAQYDYNPVVSSASDGHLNVAASNLGGNIGTIIGGESGYHTAERGAAQLSEPIHPVSEYNKEYYSYAAPEHEFNDNGDAGQVANQLKKNLRVVFIKGPENTGLENAVVQLAKSAADDRTAIYVLNKQADISDLANKLNTLNTHNANKPEVHFVKYRTKEDADNAQRAIQSQYDASLPGPSSNTHAGSAPVLNFASKPAIAPIRNTGSVAQASQGGLSNTYIPPAPPATYLPAGRKY